MNEKSAQAFAAAQAVLPASAASTPAAPGQRAETAGKTASHEPIHAAAAEARCDRNPRPPKLKGR